MEGRRSTDNNFFFGYPQKLNPNNLPTDSDVVSHSLFLRREKIASKEWKTNVSIEVIAINVALDVIAVWSKTDIPQFDKRWVIVKVEQLLNRSKKVIKIPHERRNNVQLAETWGTLFDISLCPHKSKKICHCPNCSVPHPEFCVCPPETRVPDSWQSFLLDQREERVSCLSTVDRQKVREERDRAEQLLRDLDKKDSEESRLKKQRVRESSAVSIASDSELVDSQGDRLSGEGSESDESVDTDSDWEDEEDDTDKVVEYNTLQLRRFSRECDRYKISNRAGAKIANGLLKDLAIVTQNDMKFLVCPNKLRRERLKWGKLVVAKHNAKKGPGEFY